MANICLLVLCGIPGAGKSTWAQQFIEFFQTDGGEGTSKEMRESKEQNEKYQIIHIAYDDLIPEEVEAELICDARDSSKETEIKSWKMYRKAIASYVDDFIGLLMSLTKLPDDLQLYDDYIKRWTNTTHKSLTEESNSFNGKINSVPESLRLEFSDIVRRQTRKGLSFFHWILIIDDNMYFSSMRYEYFQIARKHVIGFAQVYFPVEVQIALNRNQRRKRRVEESVINDMYNKIEKPCKEKAWERHTAIWDLNHNYLEKIFLLIKEALLDRPTPVCIDDSEAEESRRICSSSLMHQADIVLRKMLGSFLGGAKNGTQSKEERSRMAALCNSARQGILDDLRNGFILLPKTLNDAEQSNAFNTDQENEFNLLLKDMFYERLKQ